MAITVPLLIANGANVNAKTDVRRGIRVETGRDFDSMLHPFALVVFLLSFPFYLTAAGISSTARRCTWQVRRG